MDELKNIFVVFVLDGLYFSRITQWYEGMPITVGESFVLSLDDNTSRHFTIDKHLKADEEGGVRNHECVYVSLSENMDPKVILGILEKQIKSGKHWQEGMTRLKKQVEQELV
tara:strand:+ start:549 stop:884 length:336 start_codon:yes stop_codon:yes gene_type:complete